MFAQTKSVGKVITFLIAASSVLGCSAPTSKSAGHSSPVVVLAASSLKEPLDKLIKERFATVRASYAGSQELSAQIVAGAPADVFISAGPKYMDQLVEKGLVNRPDVRPIGKNSLAVVFRKDLDMPLESLADLSRPGLKLVVGDPKVPIGKAAHDLAANWLSHTGKVLFDPKRISSFEQSDLALVSKIRLGEADAAIVYQSDARNDQRLLALKIPEEVNVTVTYFAAPLSKPANAKGAKRFMELLTSTKLEGLLP